MGSLFITSLLWNGICTYIGLAKILFCVLGLGLAQHYEFTISGNASLIGLISNFFHDIRLKEEF